MPVRYVACPDGGYNVARPENRSSFEAVTEAFFAEHLGGRCEPPGGDLSGSSMEER